MEKTIPGSSRYEKHLPFARFFLVNFGTEFYTLGRKEDPHVYLHSLPVASKIYLRPHPKNFSPKKIQRKKTTIIFPPSDSLKIPGCNKGFAIS